MCHFRTTICTFALVAFASGCVDGPLYSLKRINPYYTSQWKADREHGPTFEDRFNELVYVQQRLPSMSASEQEQWAATLAKVIESDPSAEMRARAVVTIGSIQSPAVTKVLNVASADSSEKVRMAACEGWKRHQGDAAREMLLSLAKQSDETTSVRQAAIASLAAFQDPSVTASLGTLIEDRSPAIQYQVAQSLKVVTGQDFGGDIPAWKQYIASISPASNTSATEQILAGQPAGPSAGQVPSAGVRPPTDPPSLAYPALPGAPTIR